MTVHTSTYIHNLLPPGTIGCERTRVHGENGGGQAERKSAGPETQGDDRTPERGEGSSSNNTFEMVIQFSFKMY